MHHLTHLRHLLRRHATALTKTASYSVIHVVVAALVAYAVTGSWMAALALSLLEPGVQAVAYFVHDKAWMRAPHMRWRTLVKTLSYYGVHVIVAASVAWAVTGNWRLALTLSLLEPTVQMLFFFVHEQAWEAKHRRQQRTLVRACAAA